MDQSGFTRDYQHGPYKQVMGLNLSMVDIAALEARTEGWIAGLQLAAISMQGYQDTSSLIKSFTGSHRFVLDYLIEEVLEKQSDSVQSFLLYTAILDRLIGPLCDALTDQENGQANLEMLERANLFIIPLDEERRWYRYHHLFADLLRQRLRQIDPGQIPTLHSRASAWYEQNGLQSDAIRQALAAKDFVRVADLALELTPEEDFLRRAQVAATLGMTYWASGELEAAHKAMAGWIESMLEVGNIILPLPGPLPWPWLSRRAICAFLLPRRLSFHTPSHQITRRIIR